nr:MAG TPA: chromosome partitioning protein [Caudoviricetes sp.]
MNASAASCSPIGGSAVAKKFNLAALVPEMEAVSNSDSPRITMIPITELRPNGGNFYDTSNFEDLADSIELNGLLEPLCVFRRGQGTGHYVIFSGHRRYKALRLLYEKSGFEKWTEVPCIVFPDPHDANRETVMLIHANSTGRVLSNWEKAQQARRLKEALVAMREGGAELPGRIRDLVAEEMQMSASKLARLEAIGNRLTYRSWLELWKAGKLNESVAYRLSMLEWEEQEHVWLWLSENRPGLSAEKLALKDVEAAINPEPEEDETEDVSNSDTGEETIPQSPAATAPFTQGSLKWRRCLVDEPEEGQLVLVVDPDIASMPDVCAYLGGQFVDGLGRGDAMEVKSFWLWLPLPPLPETL